MRIIKLEQIHLTAGTGETTTIPLDTRPGLMFKAEANNFRIPVFNINTENVPVQQLHLDRSDSNIEAKVENDQLVVLQKYQQADNILFYTIANNNWVDSSELEKVYINASTITHFKNGSSWVKLTHYFESNNVVLQTTDFTPSTPKVSTNEVKTVDEKIYLLPLTLTSNVISTNPTRYNFANVSIPIIQTAYKQQE